MCFLLMLVFDFAFGAVESTYFGFPVRIFVRDLADEFELQHLDLRLWNCIEIMHFVPALWMSSDSSTAELCLFAVDWSLTAVRLW